MLSGSSQISFVIHNVTWKDHTFDSDVYKNSFKKKYLSVLYELILKYLQQIIKQVFFFPSNVMYDKNEV